MQLDEIEILATGVDRSEDIAWNPNGFLVAGGDGGQIYRIDWPTGRVDAHAQVAGGVLGVAIAPTGETVICDKESAEVVYLDWSGNVCRRYSDVGGRRLIKPNSIAFDRHGNLYVSDSGNEQQDDGAIVRVMADGTSDVWSTEVNDFPNGVAIDPNDGSLFVIDSFRHLVVRLEEQRGGKASAPEVIVETEDAVPDGLAFDAQYGLIIVCPRPSRVYRWTRSDGLARIIDDPLGEKLNSPTNCAFVGEHLETLAITSRNNRSVTTVEWPFGGCLPCGQEGN